jgi:hypothetical protein
MPFMARPFHELEVAGVSFQNKARVADVSVCEREGGIKGTFPSHIGHECIRHCVESLQNEDAQKYENSQNTEHDEHDSST